MAHTNSTAHYELPQFLGTDKPAWLTDINGAMSAIDTGIYTAQTKANEADAKATQNTSDISTQGGQITTLSGKVSALETAQPLDEAQIELNRQNIATNAQNIVQIDNTLGHTSIAGIGDGKVTGAIANLGGRVTALETRNYVEVTPTADETWTSVLNRLFAAVGSNEVTPNAVLEYAVGTSISYRPLVTHDNTTLGFTSSMTSTTALTVYRIDVKASGSSIVTGSITNGTFAFTDGSANVCNASRVRIYL